MDDMQRECIWYGQCELECLECCEYFSPLDETNENESFYHKVLQENAEIYQGIIEEYTDRGDEL